MIFPDFQYRFFSGSRHPDWCIFEKVCWRLGSPHLGHRTSWIAATRTFKLYTMYMILVRTALNKLLSFVLFMPLNYTVSNTLCQRNNVILSHITKSCGKNLRSQNCGIGIPHRTPKLIFKKNRKAKPIYTLLIRRFRCLRVTGIGVPTAVEVNHVGFDAVITDAFIPTGTANPIARTVSLHCYGTIRR